MSPAGGGVGGGLDCPIASTIFSILFPQASLCFRHFLTQVVCKRSQPFVVGVIFGFIGFWFFPHCFRVPLPPPTPPPAGDSYLPRFRWILYRCVSQERYGQTKFVHATQPNRLT